MIVKNKTHESSLTCPRCGIHNPASARHCCHCGHQLVQPANCATEIYRRERRRADRWLLIAILLLAILFAVGLYCVYSQDAFFPYGEQHHTPRRIFQDKPQH